MAENVNARLTRLEAGQQFTNATVTEIKDEMKGMRTAVRAMLFSLIVGLVVMVAGFLLTVAAK